MKWQCKGQKKAKRLPFTRTCAIVSVTLVPKVADMFRNAVVILTNSVWTTGWNKAKEEKKKVFKITHDNKH